MERDISYVLAAVILDNCARRPTCLSPVLVSVGWLADIIGQMNGGKRGAYSSPPPEPACLGWSEKKLNKIKLLRTGLLVKWNWKYSMDTEKKPTQLCIESAASQISKVGAL